MKLLLASLLFFALVAPLAFAEDENADHNKAEVSSSLSSSSNDTVKPKPIYKKPTGFDPKKPGGKPRNVAHNQTQTGGNNTGNVAHTKGGKKKKHLARNNTAGNKAKKLHKGKNIKAKGNHTKKLTAASLKKSLAKFDEDFKKVCGHYTKEKEGKGKGKKNEKHSGAKEASAAKQKKKQTSPSRFAELETEKNTTHNETQDNTESEHTPAHENTPTSTQENTHPNKSSSSLSSPHKHKKTPHPNDKHKNNNNNKNKKNTHRNKKKRRDKLGQEISTLPLKQTISTCEYLDSLRQITLRKASNELKKCETRKTEQKQKLCEKKAPAFKYLKRDLRVAAAAVSFRHKLAKVAGKSVTENNKKLVKKAVKKLYQAYSPRPKAPKRVQKLYDRPAQKNKKKKNTNANTKNKNQRQTNQTGKKKKHNVPSSPKPAAVTAQQS